MCGLRYIIKIYWDKTEFAICNCRAATLNIKFGSFKMELYQSGADSYLIQKFKWTFKSLEFTVENSLFPAVFTTLAMFSPN